MISSSSNKKISTIKLLIFLLITIFITTFIVWKYHSINFNKKVSVIINPLMSGQEFDKLQLKTLIKKIHQKEKKIDQFIISTRIEIDNIKAKIKNITQNDSENNEYKSQDLSQISSMSAEEKNQLIEKAAEKQSLSQRRTLEETLNTEKVNEKWSQSVVESINEVLLKPKMEGIEYVNHSCGTTLCGVNLLFDNSNTNIEEIDEMISIIADEGQAFVSINEEESTISLYFSNKKYSLF